MVTPFQEHTFDLRFRHGIQAVATQFRFARLSRGLVIRFSSAEGAAVNEGFGNNLRDIYIYIPLETKKLKETTQCRSCGLSLNAAICVSGVVADVRLFFLATKLLVI